MSGKVVALSVVPDATFAGEVLGKGFAVIPEEGKVFAPVSGVVTTVMDTRHAVGITGSNGVEVLIHVGINTVELKGECYESKVKEGDVVKEGELLLTFEKDKIAQKGYNTITPVVITNSDAYGTVQLMKNGRMNAGEKVLTLF